MEAQEEKVCVAIGNDLQDDIGTLEWVLKKWPPNSLSILILYAVNNNNMGKDSYVYTRFGKLPTGYVNDETLENLRKSEQVKIDKTLSKYIAFCGKAKVDILNIEKYDEPLHKIIIELISSIRITKLVMGITFMKSSTWKSRNVNGGLFYIHKNKPEFCELFIIRGGKLVFMRQENNEGFIEDDQRNMVGKVSRKNSFKGWLGKMFQDNSAAEKSPPCSPPSSTSNDSPNQWEKYVEEIETYFNQLLSSNADEEDGEVANDILYNSIKERDMPQNMTAAEKIELLKMRIDKAQDAIQLQRREAKANVVRRAKAEWAISLCTRQAEELEARVNTEMAKRLEQTKDLYNAKEELHEIRSEVEERRNKLNSVKELQLELSNKLRLSSLSKSRTEIILENAVRKRADVVREIEDLRRQRDVIQRRVEFCREKDAAVNANTSKLTELGFNYKEFTPEEIRVATDDFSEHLRLRSACNVYRGCIKATTVAICMVQLRMDEEAFQTKVKLLCQVQHPNVVALLGFCSALQCIVFEYMHNGCLRDTLFSSSISSRKRKQGLNWHTRIRVAAEVCAGLGFLHQVRPRPIVHGNLNPSKILLDRNNVAKIHGYRLGWCYDDADIKSDIRAFGNLVLQLLTGRNWAVLVEETIVMDHASLVGVLDEMAGEWPLDLAVELARIAIQCLSTNEGVDNNLMVGMLKRELDEVRKMADDLVANGEYAVAVEGGTNTENSRNVPSAFICPISKDIMKDPYLAADGTSYELEAIEEWLGTGHDTSPTTNLKLQYKHLTPNHTLRSLIQDLHPKSLTPTS